MNRREWLRIGGAAALQGVPPYPGTPYRNYAQCLPSYLKELALAAYARRNADLDKLTTPEAIADRKRWARQTFWSLIGGQPERTPLNPRIINRFDRGAYRVENVVYESQPNFFVTANLYVPTRGRGPFPAVLVQMGHGAPGKAYPSYQRLCQGLAKLGFVVLAFDPMGQGERIYYPDNSGKRSRTGGPTDEHSTAGRQMLLVGDSATRMQTWDAVRSLDYLHSVPFVDRGRIGATGQSGGGTATMFLLAADDRVDAAVLCSANTENYACADFAAPGSTDDAEQNFPFSALANFDRWDMLYPFAPKPLLVSVSDKDFFGTYSPQYISSGWEEFQKLKRIYTSEDKAELLAWGGTPLPHSLAYDTRLLVYNWFLRHLRNDPKGIAEEPPTQPEAEEILACTESGSTVRSLNSVTPHALTRRLLDKQTQTSLERLLRLDRTEAAEGAGFVTLRTTISRGVEIEAVEIQSAANVWVPAWLFLPRPAKAQRPGLIMLDPSGRNNDWHEGELYQSLAAQGFAVCVPDVRGLGDLAPEMSPGNPRQSRSHDEEEYAWAGLILGRPMLGQRVSDILAVIRGCKAHPAIQHRPLLLAAQGRLSVPAQCAAALSPAVNRLFLSGGLTTFRSVVEMENYGHPFANFVPGLLGHTDLPEIMARCNPRKVIVAGMLDGAGRRLEAAEIRAVYEKTRNLEVLDQAMWTAETLIRAATA